MTSITTQISTRIEHDGYVVECLDTQAPSPRWRAPNNLETLPPGFSSGMTLVEVKKLRDLCNTILEQVYEDYT